MRLTLDIETIPTDDAEVIAEIAAKVAPPASVKKEESLEKWRADEKPLLVAEAIGKTGLDGALGQVVCIGFALNDDEPDCVYLTGDRAREAVIIKSFSAYLEKPVSLVIGHNVSWDLRFLWQRSKVLGVQLPDSLVKCVRAKPWDSVIADTMTMWNPDQKRRISLDALCRALGVKSPKQDGMDGSTVFAAWQAGEYKRIAEYCKADVAAVRECWRKLM